MYEQRCGLRPPHDTATDKERRQQVTLLSIIDPLMLTHLSSPSRMC